LGREEVRLALRCLLGEKVVVEELFQGPGTRLGKGLTREPSLPRRVFAGIGIGPCHELRQLRPKAGASPQAARDLMAGVVNAADPAEPPLVLIGHLEEVQQ
jgi:hypothetical protein